MSATTTDLFDPPGVAWQRLEPNLVTVRLLAVLLAGLPFLIGGVLLVVLAPGPWTIGLLVVILGIWGWAAWLVPRRVRAMAYAIRDRDFFRRSGILTRRLMVVPYVRIQYVDIRSGPIERAFGLATLAVNTAAPAFTATLPGITPETAAQLREILTDRANLTGVSGQEPNTVPETPSAMEPLPPPQDPLTSPGIAEDPTLPAEPGDAPDDSPPDPQP